MSEIVTKSTNLRRGFLRQTLGAASLAGFGSLSSSSALATAVGDLTAETVAEAQAKVIKAEKARIAAEPARRLFLVNAHTWEKLDIVYWENGEYDENSLSQISYLMRDHRADEAIAMDKKLFDDLHDLYKLLDTKERIHVLSGYRTAATNAKLRKRSSGVAKFSLHMEGRAVDINVPGRTAAEIREAALTLKAGGVGYYASSGFVHMDTGNVRTWGGS